MPSFAHARPFPAALFAVLAVLGLVLVAPAAAAKPCPSSTARSHASGAAKKSGGRRVVKHPWSSGGSARAAKNQRPATPHARARAAKKR
jgi:hypothetical protein